MQQIHSINYQGAVTRVFAYGIAELLDRLDRTLAFLDGLFLTPETAVDQAERTKSFSVIRLIPETLFHFRPRGPVGNERRPRRQPEMRVHNVEAVAPVAACKRARCPHVGAASSRIEREHVELDVRDPRQRLDLVAHEAAKRRTSRRRVHVGDDQGAHRRGRYRGW